GGEHADFASTVAFALAKQQKKSPALVAREVAEKLATELTAGVRVQVTGPYINFLLGGDYLRETISAALKPGFGNLPPCDTRVVLEHTSANPNGPLHVGHIRNSIIGDTLARTFRKGGRRVDVQYYVNDMGRQIAIVVWGVEHEKDEGGNPKGDHHIARLYIAANRSLERDPGITAQVDALMQRVEKGDTEIQKKFREAVSECLEGIKETLRSMQVFHTKFVWESEFVRNSDVDRVLGRLRKLDQAREGATLSLDLSEFGFGKPYILRRSDGTTVYAARDLAYHTWKGRNFDRVIDVLGSDHKLIGGLLQTTLGLLGEKQPEIVYFEFVSLPEGSMSTRAGKFISADELIAQVTEKAMEEVTKRRPELAEAERRAIARSVAIAGIRFDIVRVSPEKSTVFNWKDALDFERQSGPYIQYAHARACSILEKGGDFTPAFSFTTEGEIRLAKQIARFPAVINSVVETLRPHLLATYTRDLADLFNAFYRDNPVLKSEGTVRDSRLALVKAAQQTLRESLETLGIDALSSM
ncbi:MAG: arginine--tRNA ligase, partial [Methanomicrobiales archaeon]|nr:arginine--tRNA ligase [Methanomicrobiales archaeon]